MRVLERDFHLGFGVLTASGSGASPAMAISCTRRPSSTKKRFEEVAEAASAEDLAQIIELNVDASPSGGRRELRAILPVRSELIVTLAFLRIRKNFIGLIDLFELLLGDPVPRVDVGVMLPSKLSIGLADLLVCRVSLYTQ
jgi:hypothetical protein